MNRARAFNGIFWLYIWLSNVLNPVQDGNNFWSEKLFRLNENFSDPYRLIGNAIIPLLLWFFIDWQLRKKSRSKKETTGS